MSSVLVWNVNIPLQFTPQRPNTKCIILCLFCVHYIYHESGSVRYILMKITVQLVYKSILTWYWPGFSHCHQTPLPVVSVPLYSRHCRWWSPTGTQPDTGGPREFWSLKNKPKSKFSVLQIILPQCHSSIQHPNLKVQFTSHFFLYNCRHQWLPLHLQTSTVVRVESVHLASPQFDRLIKTSITVQGMQFYENSFFEF